MAQVVTQQQMQLLPEYQEKYLKDLLANVYRTEQREQIDPATGEVMLDEAGQPIMESYAAGIGATNPLAGEPVFDEAGEPVYQRDEEGNLILGLDNQPMQEVRGGVPKPGVVGLTDAQQQGIDLGIEGIGAYSPMLEEGKQSYESGIAALNTGFDETGAAKAYDPSSYTNYMDPYEDQVVQQTLADIQRSGDMQQQGIRDQAVKAGAFGGSRAMLAQMEQQRNTDQQKANTAGQLRSAGYGQAQKMGMSAFENQLARGQSGAASFGNLGTAQVGIGQMAQNLGNQDIKTLMGIGGLEQQQKQSEYDVQRQGAIEEAYEPFQRFSYMSDVLRGVPSTSQALTTGTAPQQNVIGNVVGGAMGLNAYQQGQ